MPNSTNMNTSTILTGTTATQGIINTITVPTTAYAMPTSYYSTVASNPGQYITSSNYTMGAAIGNGQKPDLITLHNSGKEILKVTVDGRVEWAGDIDIDEAAEAFSKSITIGAEISAGITQRVKSKMRDSMFEDLINIAKEKGSLTAEDLTYLLQASKMMEKLKGKFDE